MDAIIDSVSVTGDYSGSVAVVGGGPAGMAAAYYLARLGAKVTIMKNVNAWAVLSALSFLTSELMTVSLQRMLLYLKN